MNHLPWPRNEQLPPFEVPLKCTEEPNYDGLEFSTYPLRRGWTTAVNKYGWMDCSPETAAKRAQSWLYFGLLDAFIGPRFNKHEWICHSRRSSSWVVDSSPLPFHLSDLVRSAKKGTIASEFNLSSSDGIKEHWNNIFMEANAALQILNIHMNKSLDHDLMLVGLSISVLLRSLQRMVDQLTWRDDVAPTMCDFVLPPPKFCLLQMMDRNWCEAQAGHFYLVSSTLLNYYLSGLPRTAVSSDHSHCRWQKCVGNTVNEETYQPRHVMSSCACNFVGPEVSQITNLVSSDRIPLIRLSISSGQPRLEVVAADRDTRYMSISHVWAGGLGNFRDNLLPACQLLKLYDRLRALEGFNPKVPSVRLYQFSMPKFGTKIIDWFHNTFYKYFNGMVHRRLLQRHPLSHAANFSSQRSQSVLFWMDTLCIPVHREYHPLRLKAIGNMALTYVAAEKCLVLDPELLQIRMGELSATQINAHVLCSGWVGRSWTFQEARLSRAWYAQFADGLYNPNSVENAALEHRLYSDWNLYKDDAHQIATEAMIWYHDMPAVRQSDIYRSQSQQLLHSPLYNFTTVWNHLESRYTSKPEDVHAILANTTDLSARDVLDQPYDRRMKAILRAQPALPAALVYCTGQKLRDPLNRWVPAYPDDGYLDENYGQLTPTDEGFLLDTAEANPVGFLVDKHTPRYRQLRILDGSGTDPVWIRFNAEDIGPPIDYQTSGEVLAVCYVVGHLAKSLKHRPIGRPFQGARFALRRREGRRLRLAYEYSFFYTHESRYLHTNEDEHPIVRAERTDEDAEFHVDCDLSTWPQEIHRRDTTSSLSTHGLAFYSIFSMTYLFLTWTPFYYLSTLLTRPHNTFLPTIFLISRFGFAILEIKELHEVVNEHAYKSWVKTFDETGSYRKNDNHENRKRQVGIEQRDVIALGLAMGILAFAILVPEMGFLRWIAMAVVVERVGLLLLRWVWRRTRVKGWVKEFLKRRRWW
ncbi:MAG: hypothetical protein Q9205_005022 [Flavoplaca limonia]